MLRRWLPARPPAAAKPRMSRPKAGPILMMLGVTFAALLLGAVAGLDSPVLLTLLAGPVLGVLLFFTVNAHGMLLSLFVMTFLIQGSLLYFLNLRQATWVAVGVAALFLVRIVMDQTVKRKDPLPVKPAGAIMVWVSVLAGCYCLSLILNRPGLGQLAASIKSFWPMFGVLIAFYWMRWTPERLRQLWYLMIFITVMQLPVVLYQHFFVLSRKFGAFDSVVGTFGGTQLSGGLSAVMVFFVVVTLAFVLALWNRGLMTTMRMLMLVVVCVVVILMGEVKASFIWLPVAAAFVLRKRALRNIGSLVMYGVVAAFLFGVIYTTYNTLYWSGGMDRFDTVSEKVTAGGGYFFDPDNVNYATGEVSRGASLALWAKDHASGPLERTFGYGPGASKSGSVMGTGVVAKRFAPLFIDATTLAVLLWEMGIAGAIAYAGVIIAGVRAGWRFVKAGQGSRLQLAAVETCVIALSLSLTLLFYNRTLADEPTMQLLFFFCLGYIVQCVRFGPYASDAPAVDREKAVSPMRTPVTYPMPQRRNS